MAALCAISSGTSSREKPFGSHIPSKSCTRSCSLYDTGKGVGHSRRTRTSQLVLTSCYGFLQQFVSNMKNDEVRQFLRFTTGSSVLVVNCILVTFNNLSGLACRPIAHKCGSVLELPSTYLSYVEFEQEFNAVLADNKYSWHVLAV